ncbi:dynamin family protein [Brevibacillus sp. FSL K6-2834]
MQGPFEELRSEGIRKNFEKALSSEFEIAVIATVSSGKSTLINALLGQELMPSKNAACTATIVSIKNVDHRQEFVARCLDHNGREVEPLQPIDIEKMKEFNESEDISLIEMEGKIPAISSQKMNLVLLDTPGPNNSRNAAHKEHTFRVIKGETKPMVLYVLNTTALSTNDDSSLLDSVAEQMKSGGKQSKDRFIFAVNKIDELDPDTETIEDTLRNVREYLYEKGIENPNIYPVSAEMAKLIRMAQNGHPLTKKQKGTLLQHEYFIDEPRMHLNPFTSLSVTKKKRLQQQIEEARRKGDTYQEALLHTGVPAIEEAINEYLDKYAVTAKITSAVNAFRDVVEGKKLEQKLHAEMIENEERRHKIHEQMKNIQKEIQKGQKAAALKERIQRKNYDAHEVIRKIEGKIETKMDNLSELFRSEGRVEESRAMKIVNKLREDIQSLQSDIKTDLELIILMTLRNDARELLEEYKSYVKDLLDVSGDGVEITEFQMFTSELPDVESLIDHLKYTDKVESGKTWVSTSKWWNPFSWGNGYYKTTYIEKTFVDVDEIIETAVYPAKLELLENVERAQAYMNAEVMRLKNFFYKEIDRLEKLLLRKVQEVEELSGSSEQLTRKVHEDKEKIEWLKDFVIRMDRILEI